MHAFDHAKHFETPHILTPALSGVSNFALGSGALFATGTAGVTSVIPKTGVYEDVRYILGVLNSRVVSRYITAHSPTYQGGYFKFGAPYLKAVPIPRIDKTSKVEVGLHDQLVKLVDQRTGAELAVQRRGAPAAHDVALRRATALDLAIDEFVAKLFGLTAADVAALLK